MIIVIWGVSLPDMSSCIHMPKMKALYKKKYNNTNLIFFPLNT